MSWSATFSSIPFAFVFALPSKSEICLSPLERRFFGGAPLLDFFLANPAGPHHDHYTDVKSMHAGNFPSRKSNIRVSTRLSARRPLDPHTEGHKVVERSWWKPR